MPTPAANYACASQQQSSFILLPRIEYCAVLVALVQGVVGPFNEDSCPFDEAGRKESGEGADEDFLEEGGVHPCLPATIVPLHEGLYKIVDLARPRSRLAPRFSAVTRARRASQTV